VDAVDARCDSSSHLQPQQCQKPARWCHRCAQAIAPTGPAYTVVARKNRSIEARHRLHRASGGPKPLPVPATCVTFTNVGWMAERARCQNGTSRRSSCRVHRARITGADGHPRVYYVCAKWIGAARHTAVGFPAPTPATAHRALRGARGGNLGHVLSLSRMLKSCSHTPSVPSLERL
jgi:hypothetical protein